MKKRARVDFKSSCSAYPPTYYSGGHKNIRTAYSALPFYLEIYPNAPLLALTNKKKVIQSTSAELPLLNRNKKELITTACEQLSSTEGAPTVTRSIVSLRSSFDLELTYFT